MTVILAVVLPGVFVVVAAVLTALSLRLRRSSGQRVAERRAESPLAHDLPYWSFFEADGMGVVVNVDGTYSVAFEVEGVDVECADRAGRAQLASALHSVLQNLPAGAVLQVLRWTDRRLDEQLANYQKSAQSDHPIGGLLVELKVRHAQQHPMLRRNALFIVLSRPPKTVRAAGGALSLTRKFPHLSMTDHTEAMRQLRIMANHVGNGMAAAGAPTRPLASTELRRAVYQLLHPERSKVVADPFAQLARPTSRPWAADQSAREQLIFCGIEEDRERLRVDRHLVRVITVKELPTQTLTAMLDSLSVVFDFDCRIHSAVEILDHSDALDQLKTKRDRAQMLVGLRHKRNQEAEAQAEDLHQLIDESLRSTLRIVQVAISIVLTVSADIPEAPMLLERQTSDVLRELNRLHGAQGLVDEYAQLDEFLATLPANARHGRRWLRCTSHNAAHLLPVSSSWTGDAAPLLLLHNARGNLVGIDPYSPDLPNPNGFIAGTTGSGKSALTNSILLSSVAAGARAIVIDIGGSYRRSVQLFEGDYFALQLEGADCAINPFFAHADVLQADGRFDADRMQFLLAVIERMVCDHDRPALRQVERSVVHRALEETYLRVTATPLLSDLVDTLRSLACEEPEDVEIARLVARALRLWTTGPAARFFNRPSTIRLSDTARCAAFDLKGVGDQPQLQSVVLLCLSALIWNVVMKNQTERKLIVFDEVWRFFETPASAKLIGELYRTSRKYKASILTLSQSVQDFTSSPVAAALMNNSATAYLLKHERAHEEIAQEFHLNERELALFQSLEMRRGHYTEALVCHGKHHFLSRIVLTPLEYWIATTHPADLALERQYRTTHPELSRLELLDELAKRFPHGAPTQMAPEARAA